MDRYQIIKCPYIHTLCIISLIIYICMPVGKISSKRIFFFFFLLLHHITYTYKIVIFQKKEKKKKRKRGNSIWAKQTLPSPPFARFLYVYIYIGFKSIIRNINNRISPARAWRKIPRKFRNIRRISLIKDILTPPTRFVR